MTDVTVFENELPNVQLYMGLSVLIWTIILGFALFDGIWPIFFFCVFMGLTVMLLLLGGWLLVPITITIVDDGFDFTYLTRIKKFHKLEEIVWLNTWPGSMKRNKPSIYDKMTYIGPHSLVMLVKETVHPHYMPYEAGKILKSNFVNKFGIVPPNYEQYMKKMGGSRFFYVPPSEENPEYYRVIETVQSEKLPQPKRRLKAWVEYVAVILVTLLGGIFLVLFITFWP